MASKKKMLIRKVQDTKENCLALHIMEDVYKKSGYVADELNLSCQMCHSDLTVEVFILFLSDKPIGTFSIYLSSRRLPSEHYFNVDIVKSFGANREKLIEVGRMASNDFNNDNLLKNSFIVFLICLKKYLVKNQIPSYIVTLKSNIIDILEKMGANMEILPNNLSSYAEKGIFQGYFTEKFDTPKLVYCEYEKLKTLLDKYESRFSRILEVDI